MTKSIHSDEPDGNNIQITRGNRERLNAIANVMGITPERLLNDYVLDYLGQPEQYAYDMLDPDGERRNKRDFPATERMVIDALAEMGTSEWHADRT